MLEYLNSVGYEPHIDRFRMDQVAQRSNWRSIPDDQVAMAAMHTIHVVPSGFSTITIVNPLDPDNNAWLEPEEQSFGPVIPAGRF